MSPPDKEGAQITGVVGFRLRSQASIGGDAIIYSASFGFGDPNGISGANWYRASRDGSGWSSESIMPPVAPFATFAAFYGVSHASPDLSSALFVSNVDEDGNGFVDGAGDPLPDTSFLFRRFGQSGYDLLAQNPNGSYPESARGSTDWSIFYLTTFLQLTPDAPPGGRKVYRYENGTITLASILPGGSPGGGTVDQGIRRVSDDGEVVYFQQNQSNAPTEQYRREGGETVRVDESENPAAPSSSGAHFRTSSADGSRAFFTTNDPLVTDDDQPGGTISDPHLDLYLYEHSDDPDNDENLTLISVDSEPADGTMADVEGVVGADDAGTKVYFVADGQLVAGEPTAPDRKLYLWEDGPGGGSIDYIGGLAASDYEAWVNDSNSFSTQRPGQVSADGRYLLALTKTPLTADDNGGKEQVYVYDRDADEWTCASCTPDGSTSTSPAALARTIDGVTFNDQATRNLSSSGHVFFQTAEPLMDRDVNGEVDVYVWKDGEVSLISSGQSGHGSHFVDANADGSSAFFLTHQRLAASDTDSSQDVYVARVDGGFPPPEPPPPDCQGDTCQGEPTSPPADEAPGSGSLEGAGNREPETGNASCSRFDRKAKRAAKRSRKLRRRARKAGSRRRLRLLKAEARTQKRKSKRLERRARNCRGGSR